MKETPHEEGIDSEDKRDTHKDDSKMLVRLIRSDYSKGSEKTVSLLNFNEVQREHWIVHPHGQSKNYVVRFFDNEPVCTCPYFERNHKVCKHIVAVQTAMKKPNPESGIEVTVNKISYSQDWPSYDKAQVNEKSIFMKLLYELSQTVEIRHREEGIRGRKPLSMQEMIFASALKVFTTFSIRRFMSDINEAKMLGYIGHVPHFTLVSEYMNKEEMTAALQKLITLSSLPLRSVETKFSVDSTGFRISRFTDYFGEKHDKRRDHQWIKMHISCGVTTNVVTAVAVGGQNSADNNYFLQLSQRTHDNGFIIDEMSADKAYSARDNIIYIDSIGGTAYIPFKSNATGRPRGKAWIWRKMYNYYMFQHEEFMDHYHARSNVESTNFMIKSKFTDLVRSKNWTAQVNEVLLKVLCHNIVVLIQSMFELGIEPEFLN